MSLKPGGHDVTISYTSGKYFLYDKVKFPGAYIKSLEESGKNQKYGPILEVKVDGAKVWDVSDSTHKKPWDIVPPKFTQTQIEFDTDGDNLPF